MGPEAEVLRHCLTDVAERLRRLPESRLNRAGGTARNVAQLLADAAAGIEDRAAPDPPELRAVPGLSVFAAGDQIAVTATDLAAATRGLDAAEPVWWQGVRQPLATVLEGLLAAAESLRAQL